MSVFVKFLTEPRRNFGVPSSEDRSYVVGDFEVSEILRVQKWQKSDEVTVRVVVPYIWVANNIYPSENPSSNVSQESRARYFVIRDAYGEQICFLLQDYSVGKKMGDKAMLEVIGRDARAWSETMTSAPNSTGEDWISTRTDILQRLFGRLSNAPIAGMAAWQRLPLTALDNTTPTVEEQEQGFITLSAIEQGEKYTIGSPDPLPVAGAIEEIFSHMLDYEVVPVNRFGFDGTASPWWKWMLRGRVSNRALFTENDGSLVINGTAGSNAQTETMSYAQNDYVRARYAAGENQGRTDLRGPWAGFAVDSANPPEGADVTAFLTARARAKTLVNKRISFDFTLNFGVKGIKPIIGMTTFARIGDTIYRVNVDEIASSYNAERGWMTTSPVFLSADTVKVASIKDGPYVEFQVTGSTFVVPTCFGTDAAAFKWSIDVDGVFYGEYQGISSATSNGIPLNFSTTGTHTIKIYDVTGEYQPAWARAFGFWNNTNGNANATANRNKLITVAKDPDIGHISSGVDAGASFRTYQFYLCQNLTSTYTEAMPSSVASIGNFAHYWQYYGCVNLQVASPESMGPAVTSIGTSYRLGQYYGATRLTEGALESCSTVLVSVGSQYKASQYYNSGITRVNPEVFYATGTVLNEFRESQFSSCTKLLSGAREMFVATCGFGGFFRNSQYRYCTSLLAAPAEAQMSAVQSPGQGSNNHYRGSQFEGCSALTTATPELSSGMTAINYRPRQYAFCTSLKLPAAESSGVTIAANGNFRSEQYYGCTALTEAAVEMPPALLGSVSYRSSMYQNCTALTKAAEERFTRNTTITRLLSYRSYQYSGCSSLAVAPDEFLDAPNVNSITGFRAGQYRDCSSLINPPKAMGGHAASIAYDEIAQFRSWQFQRCTKLVAPQDEYDMVAQGIGGNTSAGGFCESQYEGCIALKNDTLGRTERYLINEVGSLGGIGFRFRQFFGCVAMKYPLIEATATMRIYGSSSSQIRPYQYANCTGLLATVAEQPVQSINANSTRGFYRTAQYQNCSGLTDYRGDRLGTELRGVGSAYGASFRSNQFQGTPATNVAGNRVKFKDGAEAIPGTNVPNNIY